MPHAMYPTDFNNSPMFGWLRPDDVPPVNADFDRDAYPHSGKQCAATVIEPVEGQVLRCSVCSSAIGYDLNLEKKTPLLVLNAPELGPLTIEFTPGVRSVGLFVALQAPVGTRYEASLSVRNQWSADFEDMPAIEGFCDHVCLPGDWTNAAFLSASVDSGERIEAIRIRVDCDIPTGGMAIGWLYHWMS